MDIEETKKKRFQFLHRLYELADGDEHSFFDPSQIGQEIGFDEELTYKIVQYLEAERLVRTVDLGGDIVISHFGVREIEEALTNPDSPTPHFLPINIISIGQMTNSQIQQGSPEAKLIVPIEGDKFEELKRIIQSLKESLDQLGLESLKKSDLVAQIQTMEAQMSSSKPNARIISWCLGAIQRILEGVAANAIASVILNQIATLSGS
jgi:hypothetical protein